MRSKKIKIIILSSVALLLVASIVLGVALGGNNNNPPIDPTVRLASLSLSGQKTTFTYGEDFSVGSLVVTAKYTDNTTKVLTESEYTVDSGAYSKNVAGNYTIVITAKGSKITSSYTVIVAEKEILPAPTVAQGIYAYNDIYDGFNNWIINYEPGTGSDTDWTGRYQVEVFAPGDEQNKQQVGMIAAYSQIHGQQLGLSTLGMFDFNGSVTVRVKTNFAFEKVDIRPLSLDIDYERVEGLENTIEFTLTRPCNLSVEFDGNVVKNLMLFSDSLKEYSKPSDEFVSDVQNAVDEDTNLIIVQPGNVYLPDLYAQYSDTKHNVIVFGQGYYAMQATPSAVAGTSQYVFPSNSTVYVHGDAVIYGTHATHDAKNITIKGRGLLSAAFGASGISSMQRVSNVVFEGICLYQSISWTNGLFESQDVTFRNVRVCGQRRNNNDGFDICNSSDVLIDGCFIRTIDDCITIKSMFQGFSTRKYVENIIVQNTTLWNYQGGNGMIVGSESCTDSYNNIVVRNMDIIHNGTNRALAMEIIDSARVTNVVFDDIRMELDNEFSASKESGNPNAPTENYQSDAGNTSPIIQFEILTNSNAYYGTDTNPGVIDGVIFNNITFVGNENRKILLKGASESSQVKNIIINNFVHNGVLLNDFNADAYLQSGSNNYSNVRFTSDDLYYTPTSNGVLIDDSAMTFDVWERESVSDSNLTGGGYTNGVVRLTDSFKAKFNLSTEGYYMPYVNLKLGEMGGLFDVYFDGKLVGSVSTYSLTSEYMQYYLPMDFVPAGEHEITFTARSVPNADFDGYFLDLGIDYVNFVNVGQNNIEFEMLSSNGTRVVDNLANGGFAVDIALEQGQTIDFEGVTVRERGAQLFLGYLAGPNKGIYKFYYNGKLISNDIDMYSAVSEYREVALDTIELEQGNYTFTAKCIGKNTLSSGTNARLDYLHTRHLAVSKTFKAGYSGFYNGVSATGSVGISSGEWQNVKLKNIQNGDVITCAGNRLSMPISGVYEARISVTDFDASAFDLIFAGQKVQYTYENGVISFVFKQEFNVTPTVTQYVCKGDGTYSFEIIKTEVVPCDVDNTELRTLVEAEDERIFGDNVASHLIAEHRAVLSQAKDVLFDRTSMPSDIAFAIEILKDIALRIDEGAIRYNQATLSDNTVTVNFQNVADSQLATLYVDNGTEQAVYYSLVKDNKAEFAVASTFVGSQVKLYCQVVDNVLAIAEIEQGEKIAVAQPFTFSDEYYNAETESAFMFATLASSNTLVATFDTTQVAQNDVAMLTIRSGLNETLTTVNAVIDAHGTATFEIPDITANNVYAIVKVSGKESVTAQTLCANGVKVCSVDLGKAIVDGVDNSDLKITSTVVPNDQGVISYPLKSGFTSKTITINFAPGFDIAEFDVGLLRYCGSGGPDGIYIKNQAGQYLASLVPTTNGLHEKTLVVTREQCNGVIIVELVYGCVGDWNCTHANEEIYLNNIRFYKSVDGSLSSLKLLGNNPVEVPDLVADSIEVYEASVYGELQNISIQTSEQDGTVVEFNIFNDGVKVGETLSATVASGIATIDAASLQLANTKIQIQVLSDIAVTSVDLDTIDSLDLGTELYNGFANYQGGMVFTKSGDCPVINDEGKLLGTNSFVYPNDFITFDFSNIVNNIKTLSISAELYIACTEGGADGLVFWEIHEKNGFSTGVVKYGANGIGTLVLDGDQIRAANLSTLGFDLCLGCTGNGHGTSEWIDLGIVTVELSYTATLRTISTIISR